MAGNAFTAGVKPGGLTTSTEIRILLCYLIQHAGTPLSQGELETALLGEELVNYFELASNLSDLLEQGFVREENGRYTILPAGADIAEALADDVPRSVRDAAVRATLAAQQFARKEAQHHAQITPAASGTGYNVQCSIRDMESDVFSFSLYVPDKLTAKLARAQFIENGDGIYKLMLAALTSNDALVAELLEKEHESLSCGTGKNRREKSRRFLPRNKSMSFAGLIFPSRPQLFLLFLLPLLTKPFRPVNMKLASREVNFIFGGAHENKTERAAHRRRAYAAAACRPDACFQPDDHLHRKRTIQPLADVGIPAGTGVRRDRGGIVLFA